MVSRDGRSTYVLAYFKPLSDKALKNDAQQIENRFAGQRDVKLGGAAVANAQVNTAGQPRPRARRAARVPVHLPAVAAVLPLAASRRCCRRCSAAWRSS